MISKTRFSLFRSTVPGAGQDPALSRRSLLRVALGLSLTGLGLRVVEAATGIEQFYKFNTQPDVWLAEVFAGQVPAPGIIDTAGKSGALLQPLPGRLRYWRSNGRTAWVLDEVGKIGYEGTTAGFVVKGDAIESARVLIYRESRSDQIGDVSFLKQLVGARASGATIDKHVDNISGSTYSVDSMKRMATTVLRLNASVPAGLPASR